MGLPVPLGRPAVWTLALAAVALLSGPAAAPARAWSFVDVTQAAGLVYEHGFASPVDPDDDLELQERMISGGAAAGDYDGDGWWDLYAVGGDAGPNRLFRNLGDGSFEEVAVAAGVATRPVAGSGPIFADLDGDGRLDLVVGGVAGSHPVVFRNRGEGRFSDESAAAGLDHPWPQFSLALADIDDDGDLDLATTHWVAHPRVVLWENDANGHFHDVSAQQGVADVFTHGFTPVFADLTQDGRADLLVAGDFGTSVFLARDPAGGFVRVTSAAITDENGMGAAVGDYDGDGDLDWFVSSIWDPDGVPEGGWGVSGNRLYRNAGGGVLEDVTDTAGVRLGFWGWGSCFADFDNDGHLDLFHVNGFAVDSAVEFHFDPSRLFLSNRDGSFRERSIQHGLLDTGQGRGVICFDYDRDGDLDLFIANNGQAPRLYRNDGGNQAGFLEVELRGEPPNTEAVGARIQVRVAQTTQLRELRAGNNFGSANPVVAHFGLGAAETVDELRVTWPQGALSVLRDVPARRFLRLRAPALDACGPLGGDSDADGICDDGDGSGSVGDHPCSCAAGSGPGCTQGCDDNCRFAPNAGQRDRGSVGSATSDGIGDACQCGDLGEDGFVGVDDWLGMRHALAGGSSDARSQQMCEGLGGCELRDVVVIARDLAGREPSIGSACPAARGAPRVPARDP